MRDSVDISENRIFALYPEVLEKLLEDHASHENIYWATDSYADKGEGYKFFDKITVERITGENGMVIRPRAVKTKEEQIGRTKDKAEVFTPSWICNAQNNLIDNAWFGEQDVFNVEDTITRSWRVNNKIIKFPAKTGKTWQDYVCDTRLEITCGEAPYLVSRYDTTTGKAIPLQRRIGLLDRKFRVVCENVKNQTDWLLWAFAALKSTYGYEWQGDNLFLARESILFTFADYYKYFAKENELGITEPSKSHLLHAAEIISWNIVQMDGLKMVLPNTCHDIAVTQNISLFEDAKTVYQPCPGCKKDDVHSHNGIKQIVADWERNSWSLDEKPISVEEFHNIMK